MEEANGEGAMYMLILGIIFVVLGIIMFVFPIKSRKKETEFTAEEKRRFELSRRIFRICSIVIVCGGIINIIASIFE